MKLLVTKQRMIELSFKGTKYMLQQNSYKKLSQLSMAVETMDPRAKLTIGTFLKKYIMQLYSKHLSLYIQISETFILYKETLLYATD